MPEKVISPFIIINKKNLISKIIQVMFCLNLGDHPQSLKILIFDSKKYRERKVKKKVRH